MNVPGRPSPRTGRNTTGWCSWALPPLMAPPCRLASAAWKVLGVIRAADDRSLEPGRQLLDSVFGPAPMTTASALMRHHRARPLQEAIGSRGVGRADLKVGSLSQSREAPSGAHTWRQDERETPRSADAGGSRRPGCVSNVRVH